MLIARTLTLVVVGGLLPLIGCALPHAKRLQQGASDEAVPSRRSSTPDNRGETLIRVDQEGNVYRGDDARPAAPRAQAAAPSSARRTMAKPSGEPEAGVVDTNDVEPKSQHYGDLATAIAEPQVDAARVAELVAAHQRTAAQPERAAEPHAPPKINTHVAAATAITAGEAEATAEPAKGESVALPAGVFPTVVRTTRFELEYDDQVLGEGGIAKVELYGTRDAGRTWVKLGEDTDRRTPYTVEMPEEGVFGFRIAVAGKNGLASRPPKDGELPELWVRVDLSEPMFRANLRPAGDATVLASGEPAIDSDHEMPTEAEPAMASKPKIEPSPKVAQASHVQEVAASPAAPSDWKSHLAQAIAEAESRLSAAESAKADAPDSPLTAEEKRQLSAHLRMMYLAAGRHEDAIKSTAHDDTNENQFWSHQMHGLKLLVEPTQSPAARQASAALAELSEASAQLANKSDLLVNNLSFCTAAHSFGVYETTIEGSNWKHNDYSKRTFEPEQPIVLYFEVANFASEQTTSREFPDGAWRTSLRGSYTIVDGSGSPVEQRELKLKDDLCRNRRRDYYVAYKSWIPKLNPGRYSLELLVEDTVGGKIGTSSLDFEVVAE